MRSRRVRLRVEAEVRRCPDAAFTRDDRQKRGPSINALNGRRSARRAHRKLRGSHLATRFDPRTADLELLEDRLHFFDFGEAALVDRGSVVDSSEAA